MVHARTGTWTNTVQVKGLSQQVGCHRAALGCYLGGVKDRGYRLFLPALFTFTFRSSPDASSVISGVVVFRPEARMTSLRWWQCVSEQRLGYKTSLPRVNPRSRQGMRDASPMQKSAVFQALY